MRVDRNKKISIKKPVTTQDSYGQLTDGYDNIALNIWASVSPLIGKEYFAAEQVKSEVSIKIGIEHMHGIDRTMHVFYGNRKFEIISIIDPHEQHRELVLMCKELL